MSTSKSGASGWTFLTNHAHVLLCLVNEPSARMRDLAQIVGITERAVQRIVADLAETGYIERIRVGRQNTYKIDGQQPLRHPVERHRTIQDLVGLMDGRGKTSRKG